MKQGIFCYRTTGVAARRSAHGFGNCLARAVACLGRSVAHPERGGTTWVALATVGDQQGGGDDVRAGARQLGLTLVPHIVDSPINEASVRRAFSAMVAPQTPRHTARNRPFARTTGVRCPLRRLRHGYVPLQENHRRTRGRGEAAGDGATAPVPGSRLIDELCHQIRRGLRPGRRLRGSHPQGARPGGTAGADARYLRLPDQPADGESAWDHTTAKDHARSLRRRKIRASKQISDGLWVDWRQWAV